MSFYESEDYLKIKEAYEKSEYYNRWWKSSTAYFGVGNAGDVKFTTGGCHYNLRTYGNGSSYLVSCVSLDGGVDGYTEILKKYLEVLINHSCFSHLFLTKDIDHIVEDGFFVIDTNNNRDMIVNACIHSRLPWEYPHSADKVGKLFEAGVHPMLALYIGQVVAERNGTVSISGSTGSHHGICQHWGTTNLKAFVSGEYQDRPTFKESNKYQDVVAGFGGRPAGASACRLIERVLLTQKAKSCYAHPFPRYSDILKQGGNQGLPAKEFFITCAEKQHLILEELGL